MSTSYINKRPDGDRWKGDWNRAMELLKRNRSTHGKQAPRKTDGTTEPEGPIGKKEM